jgi:hypothetical protein
MSCCWTYCVRRTLSGVVNGKDGVAQKFRLTGHEGVSKMAEMCTITHLFCKDVSRIDVPGDVGNSKHLILNPFSNQVFTKLNVPCSLQSHIVGPLHAGIVAIVENDGGIDIRNIMTGLGNTLRKIPEVNNFRGGCICGSDLSFAGTEGGTFLALAKPSNGASVFEDDPTVHAAELEKWE